MPIRISPKMKAEVEQLLKTHNELLALAYQDLSKVDFSEFVARVKISSYDFEDVKKENEYKDIELLIGERDAYQNILLRSESTEKATDKKYPKVSLARYVQLAVELRIYKNMISRKNKRDIQVAREFGDLSENAEYQIAREEEAKISGKIAKLEYDVDNCEIAEFKDSYDKCEFGAIFTIKNLKAPGEKRFRLMGIHESDLNTNPQQVSDESPIGRAVLGKKAGDTVMVMIGGRPTPHKIIKIEAKKDN